jgi:UDP-N-acetylmuramoyl-L-alanyl-D-glutamate--2,6-diaminopimelate ligase
MAMRLATLLEGIADVAAPAAELEVSAISADSRRVLPGALFIAIPGATIDARQFIADAQRAGAVAAVAAAPAPEPVTLPVIVVPDVRRAFSALAARLHGHPSHELTVVGVTGTDGKTTTTWLLRAMLEAGGVPTGLLGTIVSIVGETTAPSRLTTPEPDELHAALASMLRAGQRACVIEVTSHGLAQERVSDVAFDAAILTRLTPEHLEYHPTFEAYRAAKARLFDELPPSAVACVGADDGRGELFVSRTTAQVIRYGLRRGDVQGQILSCDLGGMLLSVSSAGQPPLELRSALFGRHNARNILAAVACARALGVGDEAIATAVAELAVIPGRLEQVSDDDDDIEVYVDYAHTPDALFHVLVALRPHVPGRLWNVFGAPGDRFRAKRARMGRIAEWLADRLVVTTDNPRTEDPAQIIDDIVAGVRDPERVEIIPSRAEAIDHAVARAATDDVVLISGRGHEEQQSVATGTVPFSDRAVAQQALRLRRRLAYRRGLGGAG